MKAQKLLDEILPILYTVKEDSEKLQKILTFLNDEIYEEPDENEEIAIPEKYNKVVSTIAENIESLDLKYDTWERCLTFEPLESYESFKIMETYVELLDDRRLQNKLIHALNHHKPFLHFKGIIDNSSYRQNWFDFKKRYLENHVKELLIQELEKE